MRSWLLHCTPGYRGVDILFRSHYLGKSACRSLSLGMVYLGYVGFTRSTPHSITLPFLASVNFLDGTRIEQQRILLAVYPLLYVFLSSSWVALTVKCVS